jgi:hypothetical protein
MTRNKPLNSTTAGKVQSSVGGSPPDDQIGQDLDWLAYLGELGPDDPRGAFLLAAELPNQNSSPREILSAILRAALRAFAPGKSLEFTEFELGRISGTMRVLLPQGREIQENFSDELGWKATGILGKGYEARPITAYYRQRCMNPVRAISRSEAIVDTSEISFTPLNQGTPENIAANPVWDALFAPGIDRLAEQYQAIRGARRTSGLSGLIDRFFGIRR